MESKIYNIDNTEVHAYPLKKWWLPQTFTGITLNKKIYLRRWDNASDRLLRHEYIHVLQQKELGYLLFLIKYIGWWFVKGYYKNPFEAEAYDYQGTEGYLKTRKPHAWKQYK